MASSTATIPRLPKNRAGRHITDCATEDPPYNTGNEKWVYNDNLTQPQFKEWIGKEVGKEGEDACRHDKWCCMMYPRLTLLKELLRDDGAIFVSIDDTEVGLLRMVLDEIFGGNNFISNIVWEKKYSRTNDAQYLSDNHDHILLYAKSKADWQPEGLARTPEQLKLFKNPDDHPLGQWQDVVYTCNKTKEERPNLYYPITNPFTKKKVWPDPTRVWYCGPEQTAINEREKRTWWGMRGEKDKPRLKLFLSDVDEGLVANTIWPRTECGDTQEAERVLREILPDHKFLGVKPPSLLKRIIRLSTRPGDLLLDSFAGSGTTAHAVLEVNAEEENGDGRHFVLVQQAHDTKQNEADEFNICRNITAERVRRVIQGYPFEGATEETFLEEKVTLTTLRRADALLERIEVTKAANATNFDELTTECDKGVVRMTGRRVVKERKDGIGGSFTYARVGPALFSEYRSLGDRCPSYVDLARYVFYTETSRECDVKKIKEKIGFIGSSEVGGGTSYYLLYSPNAKEDREVSVATLAELADRDKNRNYVIYCEKIWLHKDQLRKFEREHGKNVRLMLVPFQLR